MKTEGNKAYVGDITRYPLDSYEEFATDTSANQMIDFLRGKGDVEIFVNSGGGDVFEAMQMYNALKRHSAQHSVKIYVDGLSASAASFMMFGGTELIVPMNATIMMHKPSTIAIGNADELRTNADALDAVQRSIESIYNANAKSLTPKQIQALVNATTWMSGQDFADKFNCTLTTEQSFDNQKVTRMKNRIEDEQKRLAEIKDLLNQNIENQQVDEGIITNPEFDDFWASKNDTTNW